jgi:amino-acid N-acetyltransferase
MNFNLRPATQSDAHSIRRLVRTARINPTGLDWRRFILATLPSGEIIGCGQVKLHADGTRELASIAVAEEYRGEGIARALIENLTNVHPQPIYLTCRANLEDLYEKFGFEVIRPAEMPPYFYRVHTLARILKRVRIMHEDLLVMRSADQRKIV